MFFGIYMIMIFDPQILYNDGFYDLVDVHIPAGSLLKPRFPAALSCRTHALGRIFDVLGGLLGQRQPEFLCAAGFSSSPHLMYSGFDSRGEWYQLTKSGSAEYRGARWAMVPTGIRCGPHSPTCPTSFSKRYFPLRIERTRR